MIFFALSCSLSLEQFLSGKVKSADCSQPPLICKKKSDSAPANIQVAKEPFFKYFSHPQSCCSDQHFLGSREIQQFFWGKPWKQLHAHPSRPSLNTVGKISISSQFV